MNSKTDRRRRICCFLSSFFFFHCVLLLCAFAFCLLSLFHVKSIGFAYFFSFVFILSLFEFLSPIDWTVSIFRCRFHRLFYITTKRGFFAAFCFPQVNFNWFFLLLSSSVWTLGNRHFSIDWNENEIEISELEQVDRIIVINWCQ